MANKEEIKKPESGLVKLDNKVLKKFNEYEQKQQELVAKNPFIKVVDSETYEIGKKRRTALKKGRTSLENECKEGVKSTNAFKNWFKSKYDHFIGISVSAEQKQQQSVSEYEQKEQERKDREAALEEKRINDINQLIEDCAKSLDGIIDRMTFETIEDSGKSFDATIDSGQYDSEVFEERLFLFEEMAEKMQEKFNDKAVQLQIDEQTRLDQLSVKQQAFINELYIEAIRVIEQNPHEAMFIQKVQNVFEVDFDFGEHTEQFESTKKELVKKAMAVREKSEQDFKQKQEQEHQTKLLEQRNRIIQIREGLLDLVFQMGHENLEEQKELIKKQSETPNGLLDELIPEWEKARERVDLSFKSKLNEIYNQIEEHGKKVDQRESKLIEIGMEKDDDVFSIDDSEFHTESDVLWNMSDVEFDTLVADVEAYKEEINEKHERTDNRIKLLLNIGLEYDEEKTMYCLTGSEVNIHYENVYNIDNEKFDDFLELVDKTKRENAIQNYRWDSRKPELEKLGFKEVEGENRMEHSKYIRLWLNNTTVIETENDAWEKFIGGLAKDVQEFIKDDAKEQARQEKIKIDKSELIEWINHSVRKRQKPFSFQNNEMDVFFGSIVDELNQWCDDKIQEIKNF